MFEWRTDPCDTRDEVMVTCKSGRSRWVLPGCTYRRGQWWHTIIEAHDREIDPEGDPDDHTNDDPLAFWKLAQRIGAAPENEPAPEIPGFNQEEVSREEFEQMKRYGGRKP